MSAAYTPTRTRISVEFWHRMIDAGVFRGDERVELIDGEMLDMAPIGGEHRAVHVMPQGSVQCGNWSEPEPDLLVLHWRDDFYRMRTPQPEDVLLLVEVAQSSLAFDRGRKLSMYARHGIAEYWIANVQDSQLEVYRQPAPDGYRERRVLAASAAPEGEPQAIEALLLPDLRVTAHDVFGVEAAR